MKVIVLSCVMDGLDSEVVALSYGVMEDLTLVRKVFALSWAMDGYHHHGNHCIFLEHHGRPYHCQGRVCIVTDLSRKKT